MNKYDDIINMPHPTSKKHKQMSQYDRASQFAPFQALTGYAEAINETGRSVDKKIELSEYEIDLLNSKMSYLNEHISCHPKVMITYFKRDSSKEGGSYINVSTNIRRIDLVNKLIILDDRSSINIDDIYKIYSSDYESVNINY